MEEEIRQLRDEVQSLKDKQIRCDDAVKSAVVAIKTKNAAIEERDAKIVQLEGELRVAHQRIAQLEAELHENKKRAPKPATKRPRQESESKALAPVSEAPSSQVDEEQPPPEKKAAVNDQAPKAPPPQAGLLPTPPTAPANATSTTTTTTGSESKPPPLLPTPAVPSAVKKSPKPPGIKKPEGVMATISARAFWAPSGESEPRVVRDSIRVEAAELRGQIRPGSSNPNSTYVNMVLRKHMRNPEESQLDVTFDLLTFDRSIGPQVIADGLLAYFKSEVTTALCHSLNQIWPAHLSKSEVAERTTNRTITLVIRLSGKEGYGPRFIEKVCEDLIKQTVKLTTDREEEEGDQDGNSSAAKVTKYEKHLHIMAMLMVLLCKRTQDMARIRCLVHDILAFNLPSPGPVYPLSSVARYWPEVLQGTKESGQPNHVSRMIQALLSEILVPVCEVAKTLKSVDKESVLSTIYHGMCEDLGWPADACPFSSEAVAEEALTDLSMTDPPPPEDHIAEAIRALELVVCGKEMEWIESHLLNPRLLGARTINIVRMLATVGKQLVIRDAVERTSSEQMRRLMLNFQDVVSAQGVEDDVKMWAVMGVLSLPGAPQGEVKQAMTWFTNLPSDNQLTLPTPFYRKVLRAGERPHCCVVVRDMASARSLDIQAIFHDLSVHYIDTQLLLTKGLPRELKQGRWESDPVGLQHLAIWQLYKTKRMEELDYTSNQPSEVIVLESDAVGVRGLAIELRGVLEEVRQRKVPWDLLALSFMENADQHQAARKRQSKVEEATRSCVVSSAAYIVSKAGAESLLKRAVHYSNVEKLIMDEMTQADLRVLTPERELFHYDDGRYNTFMNAGRGGR